MTLGQVFFSRSFAAMFVGLQFSDQTMDYFIASFCGFVALVAYGITSIKRFAVSGLLETSNRVHFEVRHHLTT